MKNHTFVATRKGIPIGEKGEYPWWKFCDTCQGRLLDSIHKVSKRTADKSVLDALELSDEGGCHFPFSSMRG